MHVLLKVLKSNLRMLYVRERFVLSLILICSFCSGIMLPFIYGVYCSYSEKLNAQLYELTLLQIRLVEDEKGNKADKDTLHNFFLALPETLTDQIDMFFVSCEDKNGTHVECRFSLQNQQYKPCVVFRDNLLRSGILNGYFSEAEELSGEKVAIVSRTSADIGDDISVFDTYYRVVATHDWGPSLVIVPFLSLDENVVFDDFGVVLAFQKRITEDQFNMVKNAAAATLKDNAVLPDMPQIDQYQILFYKSLIILVGLIGISVSLNYVIVYQYLVNKREKELSVFLICGMTRNKAAVLLMMECTLLLLPGIVLGSAVFHFTLRPTLCRFMPYLADSYSLTIYVFIITIFGIIFELSFGLIQRFLMRRQNISSMLKEKGQCE